MKWYWWILISITAILTIIGLPWKNFNWTYALLFLGCLITVGWITIVITNHNG